MIVVIIAQVQQKGNIMRTEKEKRDWQLQVEEEVLKFVDALFDDEEDEDDWGVDFNTGKGCI